MGGLTSLCLKLLPHFLNNLNETWYRSTCMVAMKCRCAWNVFHEARLIGSRAMVISLKSHSRMPVSKTTSTVFKPSTWTMLFLISCDKLKQKTWNSVIVLAHHAMWVFPNCKGYVLNKNIWNQKHRSFILLSVDVDQWCYSETSVPTSAVNDVIRYT